MKPDHAFELGIRFLGHTNSVPSRRSRLGIAALNVVLWGKHLRITCLLTTVNVTKEGCLFNFGKIDEDLSIGKQEAAACSDNRHPRGGSCSMSIPTSFASIPHVAEAAIFLIPHFDLWGGDSRGYYVPCVRQDSDRSVFTLQRVPP